MTRRRGNNEGSIYKRKDGYWVGQYLVYTTKGPKYRYLYGKTRATVAEKLTKAMAERDGGLVFEADDLKLSEYMDQWLDNSVRATVRHRTWERYEQITRVHIKPVLGKIKLRNLTPTHIRSLYRFKLDAGSSPRTVQYIHTTLRKALKDAVADGLLPRNVADGIKAPRPAQKEINPLNAEQVRTLLEAVRGDRLEALYVLAVHRGLRQDELLGLRWNDVDLKGGKLQVRRTLSLTRNGNVFEAPKSGKGRSIELTQAAARSLRSHLRRQLDEIEALGGRV